VEAVLPKKGDYGKGRITFARIPRKGGVGFRQPHIRKKREGKERDSLANPKKRGEGGTALKRKRTVFIR